MNLKPRHVLWIGAALAACSGNGNTDLIVPNDSGSAADSKGGSKPDASPPSDGGTKPDGKSLVDAAMDSKGPADTGVTCEAGLLECSGHCIDKMTDPKNCGGCGVDCTGGSCSGGICKLFGGGDAGCGPTPVVGDQACIGIDSKNVYWATGLSNTAGGAIYSVPITGGCPTMLVGKLANPHGVASDGTNIYWTDSDFITNLGGIGTATTSGGGATMIVTGQAGHPYNLAIDSDNVYFTQEDGSVWQVAHGGTGLLALYPAGSSIGSGSGYVTSGGGNVYFTDPGAGDVDAVPIGGGTLAMLATGQLGPRGIARDTANVYWTDSSGGDVRELSLTGTSPTTLASGQTAANGLAVDSTNAYWSTSGTTGTIAKVPLAGGSVTTLASMQNQPGCVAVDATSVYWIDAGGGIISKTGK